MNEHDLERDLAALRPLDVSPHLTRRIADDLAPAGAEHLIAGGAHVFWRRAAVLAAAAAVLAAAWLRPDDPGRRHSNSARVVAESPTLLTYRRAFVESPASFEALLDAHASRGGLMSAAPARAADAFGAWFPL